MKGIFKFLTVILTVAMMVGDRCHSQDSQTVNRVKSQAYKQLGKVIETTDGEWKVYALADLADFNREEKRYLNDQSLERKANFIAIFKKQGETNSYQVPAVSFTPGITFAKSGPEYEQSQLFDKINQKNKKKMGEIKTRLYKKAGIIK